MPLKALRLEKFKNDIELSTKTQISDIENKIVEAITLKYRSIDEKLNNIDNKLSSIMEAQEKDRSRGFWARLLNS